MELTLLGLAIIVLPLICYYYLWRPQLYWRNKNVKQNAPFPILGDSLTTIFKLDSRPDFLMKMYANSKNLRYFGLYQTTLPTLVIRDPDLIKQIQIKDFDHFMDRHVFGADGQEPIWSKSLVVLRGQKWKNMRATLSPTFTASKMRMMFDLVEATAQGYVDFYLNKKQEVVELELKESFARVANDVIASCGFGFTVDSLQDPTNDFYIRGQEAMDFSGFWRGLKLLIMNSLPIVSRIFNFRIFHPETLSFFKDIVAETVQIREQNHIIRQDVINIMMETRKGMIETDEQTGNAGFAEVEESDIGKDRHNRQIAMTDEDMTAQVMIFIFAGFDTISTLLSFTCYELARNSDIQDRLRQEIDNVHKNANGKLNYQLLNNLEYLDMVICEGLRKYPPGIVTDRICTKPYTIQPVTKDESPVEVNVGDILWFPLIGIHRDEEYYPNPDKFDPERFSEKNRSKIKPYTYMPFGIGPRNCIGSRFALMEAKLLLFHILRNFEVIVIRKTPIPMQFDKRTMTPSISGGCWLGYKRLHK